ncbi:MAG: hypothetical protein RBS43_01890 [Candidatus Cloacimonas sp.]|nr:hypothetical protein [Candidatus Cloacimonas sp.]
MKSIADKYKDASKITLVMDNYGTHTIGAFYRHSPIFSFISVLSLSFLLQELVRILQNLLSFPRRRV